MVYVDTQKDHRVGTRGEVPGATVHYESGSLWFLQIDVQVAPSISVSVLPPGARRTAACWLSSVLLRFLSCVRRTDADDVGQAKSTPTPLTLILDHVPHFRNRAKRGKLETKRAHLPCFPRYTGQHPKPSGLQRQPLTCISSLKQKTWFLVNLDMWIRFLSHLRGTWSTLSPLVKTL